MELKTTLAVLTLAAAAMIACGPTEERPPQSIILTGVRIVDVETGVILDGKSVLIEEGRITEIADSPGARWPATAYRPDAVDAYLAPALYDLHVHIFDERDLRLYAVCGIQAVRNMDGWEWHLRLRDQASSFGKATARLFTSGTQIQSPENASAADLGVCVARERTAGYDWIKLYNDIDSTLFSAVADSITAKDRVTGHLPGHVPLSTVLATGVYDDIAHAEELLNGMRHEYGDWRSAVDDIAARMVARSISLTTTIVANRMIADQVGDFEANINRESTAYAPPVVQAFWRSPFNPWSSGHGAEEAVALARDVQTMQQMVALLHSKGVTMLAGTDAPNPTTVPGFSLHQELTLLVDAGLSPLEALRSATIRAADHVAPGTRSARIEPGAIANFILTRNNPLDDISALADFDALILEGSYMTRGDIDEEMTALRAIYAEEAELLSGLRPDSPHAVLEAIGSSTLAPPISREALTSLVWFYMKVRNLDAAMTVAKKLVDLHPTPEAEYVHGYIDRMQSGRRMPEVRGYR